MILRRHWPVIILAAGFFPAIGVAVDPQYELEHSLARELIATMKLDEQAVQKVEQRILARCAVEKCDADLRQCLMRLDRDEITMFLESDAINALTTDEMKDAIAYFRTATGLKHLDVLRAEQGLGGEDTFFNQTPGVRAEMLAFLDTRAGYLVVTRGVLTNRSNSRSDSHARMAFWRCKPGS